MLIRSCQAQRVVESVRLPDTAPSRWQTTPVKMGLSIPWYEDKHADFAQRYFDEVHGATRSRFIEVPPWTI